MQAAQVLSFHHEIHEKLFRIGPALEPLLCCTVAKLHSVAETYASYWEKSLKLGSYNYPG